MFYSMGLQSGHHQERARIERDYHSADATKQIDKTCEGANGSALRKCITDIVEAERESRRNESDLAAQWQAADWVLWAAIIAGAQLIATIAGLYFVKRTLDATLEAVEGTGKATAAMEEANRIADDTAKRQLRAYLTASGTVSQMVRYPTGPVIEIKIVWKNNGATPANKVFLGQWNVKLPDGEIKNLGVNFDFINATENAFGPGESMLSPAIAFTIDEIRECFHRQFQFVIYGIARYNDAFGDPRETRACYSVSVTLKEFTDHTVEFDISDVSAINWTVFGSHNQIE